MADPMEITSGFSNHTALDQLEEVQSNGNDGYYIEEINDDEVLADLVGETEEAESEEERLDEAYPDTEEYEVEVPTNGKSDGFTGNIAMERVTEGRGSKRRRSSASQAGSPKKLKNERCDDGVRRGPKASTLKTKLSSAYGDEVGTKCNDLEDEN